MSLLYSNIHLISILTLQMAYKVVLLSIIYFCTVCEIVQGRQLSANDVQRSIRMGIQFAQQLLT